MFSVGRHPNAVPAVFSSGVPPLPERARVRLFRNVHPAVLQLLRNVFPFPQRISAASGPSARSEPLVPALAPVPTIRPEHAARRPRTDRRTKSRRPEPCDVCPSPMFRPRKPPSRTDGIKRFRPLRFLIGNSLCGGREAKYRRVCLTAIRRSGPQNPIFDRRSCRPSYRSGAVGAIDARPESCNTHPLLCPHARIVDSGHLLFFRCPDVSVRDDRTRPSLSRLRILCRMASSSETRIFHPKSAAVRTFCHGAMKTAETDMRKITRWSP